MTASNGMPRNRPGLYVRRRISALCTRMINLRLNGRSGSVISIELSICISMDLVLTREQDCVYCFYQRVVAGDALLRLRLRRSRRSRPFREYRDLRGCARGVGQSYIDEVLAVNEIVFGDARRFKRHTQVCRAGRSHEFHAKNSLTLQRVVSKHRYPELAFCDSGKELFGRLTTGSKRRR